MRILIVEDEEQTALRLLRMLGQLMPDALLEGPLETVSETVTRLKKAPEPDLIFLDIHLADGLSFEIAEQVSLTMPVIFTTAYDQYALRAFKLNSIDYLLKPVSVADLQAALTKFKQQAISPQQRLGQQWTQMVAQDYRNPFKQRFVSKVGDRIIPVDVNEIEYIFSENKGTWLHVKSGKNMLVDFTLDEIEKLVNPEEFFRLNRQYISRITAIAKIVVYSNSRLRVELRNCNDLDIVLSRERTRDFKVWMDK